VATPPPRVSVLIVSWNTRELTLEAIRSVSYEPGIEVIVVDNASHDGSADAIAAEFPAARLIRSETNLGFAAGVNRAAESASAPALLVLNSDARLEPGALDLLLELLATTPRAALVSPALCYPDGRPQASAFSFPGLIQLALDLFPVPRLTDSQLNGRVWSRAPVPIDHPLGACMLIRRAAWQDVGPLDTGYFMYLEEIDWCHRARLRGWQVWYQPLALAVHHGGSSTSQQPDAMFAQLWRSRLRFYSRVKGPAYNRLVRALVRFGLSRSTRGCDVVEGVRQLTR
jgi:N-acetylglucosaminyl-diphospho-decaprenol L-rhamnosyltransferase